MPHFFEIPDIEEERPGDLLREFPPDFVLAAVLRALLLEDPAPEEAADCVLGVITRRLV